MEAVRRYCLPIPAGLFVPCAAVAPCLLRGARGTGACAGGTPVEYRARPGRRVLTFPVPEAGPAPPGATARPGFRVGAGIGPVDRGCAGAWIQVVALVRNTSAGFYAGASATGWHGRESFRGGSGVEGLWGMCFYPGSGCWSSHRMPMTKPTAAPERSRGSSPWGRGLRSVGVPGRR